ncbi:hypothetical protein C8R45DRAFT_936079 [Mycena sanguinolenta]|nr:hypothetical protein C8R45DRAFT_936079 [Mycena sanguinolenta]
MKDNTKVENGSVGNWMDEETVYSAARSEGNASHTLRLSHQPNIELVQVHEPQHQIGNDKPGLNVQTARGAAGSHRGSLKLHVMEKRRRQHGGEIAGDVRGNVRKYEKNMPIKMHLLIPNRLSNGGHRCLLEGRLVLGIRVERAKVPTGNSARGVCAGGKEYECQRLANAGNNAEWRGADRAGHGGRAPSHVYGCAECPQGKATAWARCLEECAEREDSEELVYEARIFKYLVDHSGYAKSTNVEVLATECWNQARMVGSAPDIVIVDAINARD